MSTTETLRQAVEQLFAASKQYLNGNAGPFLACWSHAEDVTIFGAWGAYERGWEQVRPRLEWGATRYRGGSTSFELLALEASGNLGYTVYVENSMRSRSLLFWVGVGRFCWDCGCSIRAAWIAFSHLRAAQVSGISISALLLVLKGRGPARLTRCVQHLLDAAALVVFVPSLLALILGW